VLTRHGQWLQPFLMCIIDGPLAPGVPRTVVPRRVGLQPRACADAARSSSAGCRAR
jgi:hypothetical protein